MKLSLFLYWVLTLFVFYPNSFFLYFKLSINPNKKFFISHLCLAFACHYNFYITFMLCVFVLVFMIICNCLSIYFLLTFQNVH